LNILDELSKKTLLMPVSIMETKKFVMVMPVSIMETKKFVPERKS
jgi:hypothetical protein